MLTRKQKYVNINGMEVGAEFVNTIKEFKWRLVSGAEVSEWTSHYLEILVHKFENGRKFGLVTAYYKGKLPVETPFEIVGE